MGRSGCSALQRWSAHNAEAHDVKRRTSYFVLQGASLREDVMRPLRYLDAGESEPSHMERERKRRKR